MSLSHRILKISEQINRQPFGNYIVVSPLVSKYLSNLSIPVRLDKCNRILNKIKNEQTN
jgi:Txe/YoeB family toxin of Txe-Axe toxin-antitoxin module